MRALRLVLVPVYVFGLAAGLSIASSGCGGDDSKTGQMVVPEKSPAEANKDSMEAYKKEMMKGKTGKK